MQRVNIDSLSGVSGGTCDICLVSLRSRRDVVRRISVFDLRIRIACIFSIRDEIRLKLFRGSNDPITILAILNSIEYSRGSTNKIRNQTGEAESCCNILISFPMDSICDTNARYRYGSIFHRNLIQA